LNATVTCYLLALASNQQPHQYFQFARSALAQLGRVHWSKVYLIPCRDSIGADYWNAACLLESQLSAKQMQQWSKELEQQAGRIRPSHCITLDVDVIAWGNNLQQLNFNSRKIPLPLDVRIPLQDIGVKLQPQKIQHPYPCWNIDMLD